MKFPVLECRLDYDNIMERWPFFNMPGIHNRLQSQRMCFIIQRNASKRTGASIGAYPLFALLGALIIALSSFSRVCVMHELKVRSQTHLPMH
jgi:hypothetical protein